MTKWIVSFVILQNCIGVIGLYIKIEYNFMRDLNCCEYDHLRQIKNSYDDKIDTRGVLVGSRWFHTNQRPIQSIINGKHNLTVDILWRNMQEGYTFYNSQEALSLMDDGAMIIFEVSGGVRSCLTGFGWAIPVISIGTLPGTLTNSEISTTHCVRALESAARKIQHVDIGSRLLSESHEYSTVLLSTLYKIQWKDAILVYDDETESIISILPDILNPDGIFLTMYKIDNTHTTEDLHSFLHNIHESTSKDLCIVVVCSTEMMTRLMHVANNFDKLHRRETALYYNSRWLIFNVGNKPPDNTSFLSNLFNVAMLSLPSDQSLPYIPQYLTLQYMLYQISESDFIMETYGSGCLNNSMILQLSRDVAALWSKIRKSYIESIRFPIRTLMFHQQQTSLDTVGFVSLDGYVDLFSNIFPNVNHGLNGKLLTITTLEYSPFEYLENGTWKGLCIEILDEMKRNLNFTYKITFPRDGEWGRLVDGSWTGMVGQLERREVDLMAAPLSIQEERTKVMDFTLAFFWDISVILMKKPDPKETQWRRIIEPLEWKVIVLTGGLVPIVALILSCLEAVSPAKQTEKKFRFSHFYDQFLYAYGCIFMQGSPKEHTSQTSKTMVCCWWLFCIILGATYCGNLIAYLTVNKQTPPFHSLDTMVEQDDYQWGTLGGTYWVTWFEHSRNPVLQKVWSGMRKFNKTDSRVLSPSTKQHMTKVKEGKYGYIGERSYSDIITSESCDLQVADEEFLPLQYGFGLPRNSPFTNMFSDMILNMHETGLMKIWKQRNWPQQSFCSGSLVNEAKPITWIDIQTAFGFLGIGVVLSVPVLIVEICVSTFKRKKLTLDACSSNSYDNGALTLNERRLSNHSQLGKHI